MGYEERKIRNMNNEKNKALKNRKNNLKENKYDELSQRQELIEELENMTKLLKKGVTDLRKTLKEDENATNALNEETYGTLDKVTSLNNRLTKYVQATSGMTCTMCLMMVTVVITWIW